MCEACALHGFESDCQRSGFSERAAVSWIESLGQYDFDQGVGGCGEPCAVGASALREVAEDAQASNERRVAGHAARRAGNFSAIRLKNGEVLSSARGRG
jgi:hypothetical protein